MDNKNKSKVIPINNINKISLNIKKECSICFNTRKDMFGNIYLQDFRCSNKCNKNKNGEKTWYICNKCYIDWRKNNNHCFICRGTEDESIEIKKNYNKCEKIISAFYNIPSKIKKYLYYCKKLKEINIISTVQIFFIGIIFIIFNFAFFFSFFMFCMKMKQDFCFSCFILSFIGLVHTNLCFVVGLTLHKIIEFKKVTQGRLLFARIYCIISMSLILTFIAIMNDCKLDFDHFYYFIFYIFGFTIFNCLCNSK